MGEILWVRDTAPETEPVSLDDAKLHLRMVPDDDSEDVAIVEPLIVAAREYVEGVTGRTIARRQITACAALSVGETLRLPRPPVIEIAKARYMRTDGAWADLPQEAYTADAPSGTLTLQRMPEDALTQVGIQIQYEAGYTAPPMALRQAMLLLIGHWYQNREAVQVGSYASVEVAQTVRVICNQYRTFWF